MTELLDETRQLIAIFTTINKRSNDIQKHKDFIDGEFEIVDVIPAGGGSSEDVGKFVCVTEAGALPAVVAEVGLPSGLGTAAGKPWQN